MISFLRREDEQEQRSSPAVRCLREEGKFSNQLQSDFPREKRKEHTSRLVPWKEREETEKKSRGQLSLLSFLRPARTRPPTSFHHDSPIGICKQHHHQRVSPALEALKQISKKREDNRAHLRQPRQIDQRQIQNARPVDFEVDWQFRDSLQPIRDPGQLPLYQRKLVKLRLTLF